MDELFTKNNMYPILIPIALAVAILLFVGDVTENSSFTLSTTLTVLHVLMNIFLYFLMTSSIPYISDKITKNTQILIVSGIVITFLVIWSTVAIFNTYLIPKVEKRIEEKEKE